MRSRFLQKIAVAFLIALTSGQGYKAYIRGVPVGDEINGIVVHVADGDTFRLNGIRIRLWGVDAPEVDQQGYLEATSVLQQHVLLRKIRCVIRDRDRYNRIVAQCFDGKKDIGAEVIASGWARDYRRHSKNYYAKEEALARKERKGLWRKAS